MPEIKKLDVNFEYKDKSFKICNYIASAAGILFEVENIDGKHIDFFRLETICNNAKEKLKEEHSENYAEFFI